MNTAADVDFLIDKLKDQGVPLSEACWQTALACVGWPYVFGAWGAECTVSERKKRFSYNPSYTSIKNNCQVLRADNPKSNCTNCKWFPGQKRTRCFDCRGFTDWVLKQYGFDLEGEGATSQWNSKKNWCAKGTVEEGIPQGVLVNLFIQKGSTMSHTGFYYNGDTCECSNGVQYFSPMKKNRWTHWAVANCFALEMGAKEPVKDSDDKSSVQVIKRGQKGEKVKELQRLLMSLGYKLPKFGADGDFGAETEKAVKQFQKDWDLPETGVVDQITMDKLNTVPKPKKYSVTVEGLSKSEADELCKKYSAYKCVTKEMDEK